MKSSHQTIGPLGRGQPRRSLHACLIVCALAALLMFTAETFGQAALPKNPFVILLQGVYQPVVHAPNLGLSQVDLNDGTFSQNSIFNISGIPGSKKDDKAVGTFYVQFAGDLCAYHVPGGSFSARFTMMDDVVNSYEEFADGSWTLDGTFELDILEATGIFKPFAGGHIHMVDILKYRAADDTFLEYCFCHVSH